MVAQFSQNSPLPLERKKALIAALQSLPSAWAVVAVNGNKAPYRKDWQKRVMRCPELIGEIQSNRAKGFGLLTGELSGGILAIDADGEAAHALLAKYGELPRTVSFSSGRPGRCQYLLQVPKEFWGVINSIKTEADGQELGFRWNGKQSVLPPSVHPETGEYRWVNSPDECAIAECPKWVIEIMLNSGDRASSPPTPVLPVQTAPLPKKLEDIDLPVPASIPLELCLAKETRALLNGVAAGTRNESGIKVARDLIGTADYLKLIGQSFDGEPRQLFQDFAARCTPPLPPKETDTIWRSAEKTNPAPACREEGVKNCLRGWYWTNHLKSQPTPQSPPPSPQQNNVIQFPPPPQLDDDWLRKSVIDLIEKGVTGSKLTVAIAKLAKESGSSTQIIQRIYYEVAEEVDREENRDEIQTDLDSFLKAKQARLEISSVLPIGLANPIKLLAQQLGLRPETYLSVLLATVSTLHRNNTWVRLWETTDFEVTPNLFVGIVADPSQYKSPILKAIATKPLSVFQKQAKQEHEQLLKQYEADLKEWEENGEGDRPVKPARKLFYFTDATSEGIVRQFNDRPESGLLNLVDELAGKFKSANQYRNGRGSDEEDLLSLYDGTGKVTLRATGIKSDLEDGLNFGLIGSIQPKILQKFLRDCQDSNGNWARFIFVNQPLAMSEWNHDSGGVDLTALLVDLYSKISQLPARTYTLSPEAKEVFRIARNRSEKLRVSDTRSGMRAYWGKVPGRIGKLAVNLHAIHSISIGSSVGSEIPVERVKEAIDLCDFYSEQILSLYAEFEDSEALPPKLAKVLELSVTGAVTLRQIGRSTKWKANEVKGVCDELVTMGRGQLIKIGRALAFQQNCHQSVTNCHQTVASGVTQQNHTQQALQQSVPTVTNCHQNLEIFSDPPPPLGHEKTLSKQVTVSTVSTVSENPCGEGDTGVAKTVTANSTSGDSFKIGDRVILAAKPENVGTITRIESGAYGAEFPCTTQAGEPGIDYSLYDAAQLRLAPPSESTLGISVPPSPPDDGNPKGRRLKR